MSTFPRYPYLSPIDSMPSASTFNSMFLYALPDRRRSEWILGVSTNMRKAALGENMRKAALGENMRKAALGVICPCPVTINHLNKRRHPREGGMSLS